MTIDEAKQEIPTFESFRDKLCACCYNDVICNMHCKIMRKVDKMFDIVQQAWARYDGDIVKIDWYIKGLKYNG